MLATGLAVDVTSSQDLVMWQLQLYLFLAIPQNFRDAGAHENEPQP